jgi:hypothetical protein
MDDAARAHAMTEEIRRHGVEMNLVLRPESVVLLVGLLQLADRHPEVGDQGRAFIRTFVEGARAYFATCPTILAVIAEGDHPMGARPTGPVN